MLTPKAYCQFRNLTWGLIREEFIRGEEAYSKLFILYENHFECYNVLYEKSHLKHAIDYNKKVYQ